jgi:hypothetical protein
MAPEMMGLTRGARRDDSRFMAYWKMRATYLKGMMIDNTVLDAGMVPCLFFNYMIAMVGYL